MARVAAVRDCLAWYGSRQRLSAGLLLVLGMASSAGSLEVSAVTPELLDKARVQGAVLVIVTLRVPAGASRDTVATVKQTLVAEIASTRHRIVRELVGLPQIVLEASDDTLRILGASSNVLRIEESVPRPPIR